MDNDGNAPVFEWMDELEEKLQIKIDARIELLAERGHDLQRPHAAILRDNLYELRIKFKSIHYRVLYFYIGKNVVVLAHACTKISNIPIRDMNIALKRMKEFTAAPNKHTYSIDD